MGEHQPIAACGPGQRRMATPVWEIVLHPLTILAAAQLLQLRERAPRWYRRMIVTGVLFLPLIPLFRSRLRALSPLSP